MWWTKGINNAIVNWWDNAICSVLIALSCQFTDILSLPWFCFRDSSEVNQLISRRPSTEVKGTINTDLWLSFQHSCLQLLHTYHSHVPHWQADGACAYGIKSSLNCNVHDFSWTDLFLHLVVFGERVGGFGVRADKADDGCKQSQMGSICPSKSHWSVM